MPVVWEMYQTLPPRLVDESLAFELEIHPSEAAVWIWGDLIPEECHEKLIIREK
jgi:hypothetical protein